MKLKRAIIETMGRDDLKAVCNDLEIDQFDRRSREDMADVVSRARRATAELLIEYLREKQVKAVCDLVSVSSRGRRGALIKRLLGRDEHSASSGTSQNTASGSQSRQETDGADAHDEDEVTWMSANESESTIASPPTQEGATSDLPIRPTGTGLTVSRTELVWPGKYDDAGALVEPPRLSLPFQVIEVIEEGRASREALAQGTLPLFGAQPRSREEEDWRNKLIWGDNLYALGSLVSNFAASVDLLYIDPPFLMGRDFKHRTIVGEQAVHFHDSKVRSIIEQKAYYDSWAKGRDSYLPMIYQRLLLAKELLSRRSSVYIHLGPNISHYVKPAADEIFSDWTFTEISWKRTNAHGDSKSFGNIHDVILYYRAPESAIWHEQFYDYDEDYTKRFRLRDADGRRYMDVSLTAGPGKVGGGYVYEWKGVTKEWVCPIETMQQLDSEDRIYYTRNGVARRKHYLDEAQGVSAASMWTDISPVNSQAREALGYDTQKPEALLERIIAASTDPGSIVLDFFAGSGTSLAVAERLGRRWIGCDLSRFAVHVTRKRLLDLRVRDEETHEERGCRPFEVLNLGKYERKYWQGVTFGNGPAQHQDQAALAAYVQFVLDLYSAQPLSGQHVHGKKGPALVHVGAVDAPVTITQVEQALQETKSRGARELHVLGWEWEMGLHDPLAKMARAQHGVMLRLLNIPREVMDRRATESGDVQFFDLAYLEVELNGGGGRDGTRKVKVKLTDFVIPNAEAIPDEVRKVVRKWSDYIDYWAVDWDFRDDTFINQWQTYRTPKDRTLALESAEHTYDAPGTYRVLVKVVDIFGNDTSHLLSWEAR